MLLNDDILTFDELLLHIPEDIRALGVINDARQHKLIFVSMSIVY